LAVCVKHWSGQNHKHHNWASLFIYFFVNLCMPDLSNCMQDVALGIKSLESSMRIYFCKQTKPNYLKLSHTSSQSHYIFRWKPWILLLFCKVKLRSSTLGGIRYLQFPWYRMNDSIRLSRGFAVILGFSAFNGSLSAGG
jgi:hypothetical protein